jgi:hypothetical protein
MTSGIDMKLDLGASVIKNQSIEKENRYETGPWRKRDKEPEYRKGNDRLSPSQIPRDYNKRDKRQ